MTKRAKARRSGGPLRHNVRRGKLIGWKWGYHYVEYEKLHALIKLSILPRASVIRTLRDFRYSPNERRLARKLRASEAKVLGVWDAETLKPIEEACSQYDLDFKYRKGKAIRPKWRFDVDTSASCSSGIHFFMLKRIALEFATA